MAMPQGQLRTMSQEQPQQPYIAQVAVSPEQALQAYQALQEITKRVLQKGTDYDTIPGTPKPSLLKPGAENLLRFYGLGHKLQTVEQVKDWEKGFFYYSYKITVFKTNETGVEMVLSECEGSANSKEKRYKNQDPFMLVNTLQKMAIKRALVGAALQATGASGLFTQDIEDMDIGKSQGSSQGNGNKRQYSQGQKSNGKMTGQSTEAQQNAVFKIGKSKKLSDDEVNAIIKGYGKVGGVQELTKQGASNMISLFQETDTDELKNLAAGYLADTTDSTEIDDSELPD